MSVCVCVYFDENNGKYPKNTHNLNNVQILRKCKNKDIPQEILSSQKIYQKERKKKMCALKQQNFLKSK